MKRQSYRINITGKNSSEIYSISYPDNLIKFISYDFAPFKEKCVELCRVSMRSGEINRDEVSVLRNSISPCHKYFEKNIHGVFEKIVVDFWIEYICRKNKIDEPTLWDSFSPCRSAFESALFKRLCDYRYNRGINQWTNLIKTQEYARKKTEFVFGKKVESHSVAIANAGYFDLLFNVAANEMGCGELSVNKVYSGLRTPNSPFLMAKLSRDIMQKVLPSLNVDDNFGFTADSRNSDREAMEVFSAIKSMIPNEPDSLVSFNSIMRIPQRVYIPEGFKSVIDLEVDVLLESSAVIQKCDRCHEYYLKDKEYDYNYCQRVENGRTCLDIMGEKLAESESSLSTVDTTVLYARCDQLYKEMAERVNVDINQRDFSDWYKYMALIRDNVASGLASMDDFENFAEYSRTISFAAQNRRGARNAFAAKPAKSAKTKQPGEKPVVREFEFERIERKPANLHSAHEAYSPPIPPIPPNAPIPYAPPAKTVRVIRGVAPVGIKELNAAEPQLAFAVAEKEAAGMAETAQMIPEPAEFKEFRETDISKKADMEGDTATVVTARTPRKTKKTAEERRPKTRIGKGLLLQNPYEKGMLQNPYIRDLIKSDDNERVSGDSIQESIQVTADSVADVVEPNIELEVDGKVVDIERDDELNTVPLPEPPSAPQLDFNRILSGFQRNDRFEASPLDSPDSNAPKEDAAVSHKTKRVLDTVLGKSRVVNPFVKSDVTSDESQSERK
ncbi:MAG: DUF6076 domain-containing protein [Oscillospiraceae bacterium]|nr:DUF6076 domain-containing protein [Oscillospiraceae bacterium]